VRYIVIGPGAVGGTVGGLLAHAGHDVVLVARGEHREALLADGLTVATPARTITVRPPVVAHARELRDELAPRAGDALLVAVKSQDTAAVLDSWNCLPLDGSGGLAADLLPVFCLQNGVENERVAARRFTEVYGVRVELPAELVAPGGVLATGSPVSGVLEIGRYPAGTGPAAERFAADLNGSGFAARVTDQVMAAKYTKLLRNLRNAIVAACGSTSSSAARTLAELAVAEAVACYQAAGIEYLDLQVATAARDDSIKELAVDGVTRGGVSSWQSLNRRSGSAETDYLNGEIVLLGRLHGVPTPVNEMLRQVMNVLAARREAPGSVDPDALLLRVR